MIEFRLLRENDLPLLYEWLNQFHMKEFYQKEPITLDAVVAKYTPRILQNEPTFSHIALLKEKPLGYIQCYKNIDWPEYAKQVGLLNGISVDYFIGDPSMLGKGYGSEMVGAYLKEYAFTLFPEETDCYVCHDAKNLTATRSSEKSGFKYQRDVIENGVVCKLLCFSKCNPAS